jgi:phage regulator Rha-like protein
MGGKCPFWLFVGLLSSDESVQSRSVCRTEKRVFFIVFVGISDIFLIFAPKIKTKKRMGHQEDIAKTESKIIVIRDIQVILDRDVAELYGVETKEVNKAVRNNPDKFPDGYIIELTNSEKEEVVKNFHHLSNLKYSHATTKAFTEKGLYMLATILKSPLATEVTIAIIETFSKVREVSRAIAKVNDDAEKGIMPKEEEQGKIQNLMGEVLADNLPLKMRKMAFSLNLGFLKVSVETTRGKD